MQAEPTPKHVLYTIQIDEQRTKQQGRKLPKVSCVPNPNIREIASALAALNIDFVVEADKRHPREPWVPGRVRIPKVYGRLSEIARSLREIIIEARAPKPEPVAIESHANGGADMSGIPKLVPRRKPKKKERKF